MKRIVTMVVALALVAGVVGSARAAGNASAKIMLHGLSVTTKSQCTRTLNVPTAGCTGYDNGVSNLPLAGTAFRYLYLLVVNGSQAEGIAGLECGIGRTTTNDDLTGLDIYNWVLCATLEFQTPGTPWGAPGSGNLITWDSVNKCQVSGTAALGAVAVAGYFYCGAYSPECISVTPRPVSGFAKVANCASIEDVVYVGDTAHTFLGRACFGGPGGINPCGRELVVPVENTTWSGVKTFLN